MAMSDFLIRILDDWDIKDPHLICPGTGTAAALFAAADYPGRVRSLVIGSGGAAYPLAVGGALQDLIQAPGIDAWPQDPRALVQALMTELGPAAPASDIIADYIESNAGDRFSPPMSRRRTS